ncbi:MAG: DUF1667 domain-containing protein [Thermofilaceae archaeon]
MSEVTLICIICPAACELKAVLLPNDETRVEGAGCARGVEYAKQEVLNPRRMIVTVVKVKGGDLPVVSVKTSQHVPKSRIAEIMRTTAEVVVDAPVEIGQVVAMCPGGVELIATRRVKALADQRALGKLYENTS